MPSPYLRNAPAFRLLLCFLGFTISAPAEVVINEIMYRPGTGYPEDTSQEYIEIYNPDAAPADLSGWAFTSGVSYTFPAATMLPAGGYLVIAANPTAVATTHSITGVLGPWAEGASLSNKGEKITLSKPGLPAGSWTTVDKVNYNTEGDWGTRVFVNTATGWDWAQGTATITAAAATDTITTSATHGLKVGDRVRFVTAGALPTGLLAGNIYYVKTATTATSFTVATTSGGTVVDITAAGTGVSTVLYAGNKSLELRNPAVDNDLGQNWAYSTGATGGTPGAPNTAATTDLAPIITKVKHSPAVPKSTQEVTISCQLLDETAAPDLIATLYWRLATSTTPPNFQTAPMTTDGTGLFTANLGVQNNLTVVEFYVSASDGTNSRTWPAPNNLGQTTNCQYQVDNETSTNSDSYYRLVLTTEQNSGYTNANSSSDQRFNAAIIVSRGLDTEIRYGCDIRSRGNSSRSYTIPPTTGGAKAAPIRLSLSQDNPLPNGTSFDINPKTSYLQYLGNRLSQAAGLVAPDTVPIEFRRNGVELTNSSTASRNTSDFGYWVLVEAQGGDYIDHHYPAAKGGQIYKKTDGGGLYNYYWRSVGWTVPADPDGLLDNWAKDSGGSTNDWTDLTSFFQVWQAAATAHFPAATTGDVAESNASRITTIGKWNSTALSTPEYASVGTVSDLQQWARFLAVSTILLDTETKVSNGVDDDYSIYFAPDGTGLRRAQFLPHDLDTLFGLGDTSETFNSTGLYDATANTYIFRTLLPLLGNSTTTGNAEFRALYFTTLRELYGTVFNADTTTNPYPPFYAFVDNHLTGWVPAATIASLKTFATQRQAYLLSQIAAGTTPITPPAATSQATLVSAPSSLLMISEILANNVSAYPNGATYPDVIELYNADSTPRDLSGLSLTDDPAQPSLFVFPAGTSIPANGYLIVYADSAATPGLHTGFGLSQNGDQLRLYAPGGSGSPIVLDTVTFGPQPANYSIGRTGATRDTWTLCTPTIGAANTAVASFGAPGGVFINEWLSNPGYRFSDDFLELYNPASAPVALAGMSLTDDFINYPAQYVLPQLSYLAPGGYLTFLALGGDANPAHPTELPFKIGSAAGWLALIGANGTIVDRVDIVSQPEDASTSRTTNGGANTGLSYLPSGTVTAGTRIPTPGTSNAAPSTNLLNLLNFLRITEVSYNPSSNVDAEFIEFANLGSTVLDLTGVRITNGVDFVFPACSLPPGARALVVRSASIVRSLYGNNVNIFGEYSGRLDNTSEKIVVQLPAPYDMAIVSFTYSAAWYPTTSGGGFTLELKDVDSVGSNDGLASNWKASTATGGSPPTVAAAPAITSSLTQTAAIGIAFSYQITASNQPSSYGASNLPAGLSFSAASGLLSGTPTVTGTFGVPLTANNVVGSDNQTLNLTISNGPPPAISSTATASSIVGDAFSYQITASNSPTSFGASGLPASLTFNSSTGLIGGTAPAAGAYPIQLSATNNGGTGTLTLNLTVAASGPVAAFTWDTVGAQFVNVPFSTTLRAVDSKGRAVTSFTGSTTMTGQGTGTNQAIVLITECGTGDTDYFEIQNVGNTTANTAGWFVVPNRGNTNGSVNGTHPAWPLPDTIAPGQVLQVREFVEYPYESISWGSGSDPILNGWCMLCDNLGAIQDFVAWGYTRTELNTVNFNITVGSTNYPNITIPSAAWPGDGATLPGTAGSNEQRVVRSRTGTSDNNSGVDWQNRYESTSGRTPRANPGIQNATSGGIPGLGTFIAAPPTIAVTPTSATFVNGVWTGNITIAQAATGMKVIGTDTSSHTGISNTFDVTAQPAPVINSPSVVSMPVNQPFSIQLTATNSPTVWTATPLPAGLTLNASTGVISGTPTTVGATSTALTAKNNNPTAGTAGLSLTVLADDDGDGIPNTWETTYTLNPASAADANGDLDGDGVSNYNEYLAGTDPTNRASSFQISSTTISGNNVVLQWTAVNNRRYRVWTATSLPGAWTSLNALPLTYTGSTMTYTHVGGALTAPRFYRVEAMQ
jgi:hypothetical protein